MKKTLLAIMLVFALCLTCFIGCESAPGEKGDQGVQGEQGIQGEKGEAGEAGKDGADGKSAYELAVENGFEGTLEEWLLTLVGNDGADGKGIESIEIVNGELVVTYTDGTVVNLGALAENEGTEGLEYYPLPDGTYGVKMGTTQYLEEVVIPAMYKGKAVTQILDEGFKNASNLKSITIPDSVTSIGELAFSSCDSLTSVVIPDSVTSIGYSAFSGCTSLTSVVIGDSVQRIGSQAFDFCDSLTSVYITDIAKWCAIRFVYYSANPLFYAENLYLNGELVTELVIPDSVTSIGDYAFYGCDSLTSVEIPDSVTSIGNYSFYNCSSLTYNEYDNACYLGNEANLYLVLVNAKNTDITSCEINRNTRFLHSYAFRDCDSLTSVVIPDSMTNIGYGAFLYCESLVYNEYDNAYYLGNEANPYLVLIKAKNTHITSCEINSNAKIICPSAFYDCDSLTSVEIGDGVASIGGDAFYDCDSLASVVIPDSVTSIGDDAFCACNSLTSVEIGDSVTSIGVSVFNSCTDLASVVIPESVTSIGDAAFWTCTSLASVYYTGSEEGFAKIKIGLSNDSLTDATIIYNYVPEE